MLPIGPESLFLPSLYTKCHRKDPIVLVLWWPWRAEVDFQNMSLKIRYADGTWGDSGYRRRPGNLSPQRVSPYGSGCGQPFSGATWGLGPQSATASITILSAPKLRGGGSAKDRRQDERARRSRLSYEPSHHFERRSHRIFHRAGGAPESRADPGEGRRKTFLLPAG